MQRTTPKHMVPLHAFVPGRPSVRGFLYRQNHMNAFTRINAISWPQRTEEEYRLHNVLKLPEHYTYYYVFGAMVFFACYRLHTGHSTSRGTNRDFTIKGGVNQLELRKRNKEMAQIFELHREMVDTTRKQIGERPAVFDPPDTAAPWWDTTATSVKLTV